MPIIRSLSSFTLNSAELIKSDYVKGNELAVNITKEILTKCPEIVADYSNNKIEKEILENEILKQIEKKCSYPGINRDMIIKNVFDFMFGYGELQKYIDDSEISDIDGTKYNEFAIKKRGERIKIDVDFINEKTFDTFCRLIAVRNNGILNDNDSQCRVTDKKYRLRVNLSISPRNISGPAISIRKHRIISYSLEDLYRLGMFDEDIYEYLSKVSKQDSSIIFCGKGGAGKTTLLRAIVNCMPKMDRVLITESDSEVYPDKEYCIQQKIKKKEEGGKTVTLQDLIKDGLTMSLDTYVVGEVVGPEAYDFIKAAFTGHRVLGTTHSESAKDSLLRILTLSKTSLISESDKTLKELIGIGIDVVVFLKEFKIHEIIEVSDYNIKEDSFNITKVFDIKNGLT